MEIILLADVEKVGKTGDVVKVKDGYLRNYLMPRKLAVLCTKNNRKIVEDQIRLADRRREKEKQSFVQLAEKIEKMSCTISVQAGEEDKLYGTVTNVDIQKALALEGVEIDKRKISFEEPIKKLGIYTVTVELHPDVKTSLKVWVVKE
ncbi:MAG: 50S ribosomal protein L9 [Candidatus Omnitrophica bacterium]|nr:50S ribosomal protein L9 [Candidatus Omnitrophota bacterium]